MGAKEVADSAVEAAASLLKGSTRDSVRVDAVFSYGAVDLETEHLVVWILLSGLPDDQLPEWYFPVPGQLAGVQNRLRSGLHGWLNELRDAVRAEFSTRGWPDSSRIRVGFDSSTRVATSGGYSYFNG